MCAGVGERHTQGEAEAPVASLVSGEGIPRDEEDAFLREDTELASKTGLLPVHPYTALALLLGAEVCVCPVCPRVSVCAWGCVCTRNHTNTHTHTHTPMVDPPVEVDHPDDDDTVLWTACNALKPRLTDAHLMRGILCTCPSTPWPHPTTSVL